MYTVLCTQRELWLFFLRTVILTRDEWLGKSREEATRLYCTYRVCPQGCDVEYSKIA
jgi:hypothetical protein